MTTLTDEHAVSLGEWWNNTAYHATTPATESAQHQPGEREKERKKEEKTKVKITFSSKGMDVLLI